MLCQFLCKNFKSYREETVFDFQAAAIPEFKDSLIKEDKCGDLLPVSVIYGPNGGGKTTLLQALMCLISTVVWPVYALGKNRINIVVQQKMEAEPFLYDDESAAKPIEFQIFFRAGEYEYGYYLALCKGEVFSESLDRKKIGGKKTAHIFNREDGKITTGTILTKEKVNTNLNTKMPFLSFLAINYDIPLIAEVQEWFEGCIIRDYAHLEFDANTFLAQGDRSKKKVLHFLHNMDIDVSDYRFDKRENMLYLKRQIRENEYELSFAHESEGTKKLVWLLPILLIALQEGRLVVIDELDAKLHPKLLRYVIRMFKNPSLNKHGAQLLFTSHDMATMKNTVFRRDEIWFAALDENHSSEMYSLYDIRKEDNERVNNTAAFAKQYLEGRYGADPYLQNMLGEDWQ